MKKLSEIGRNISFEGRVLEHEKDYNSGRMLNRSDLETLVSTIWERCADVASREESGVARMRELAKELRKMKKEIQL